MRGAGWRRTGFAGRGQSMISRWDSTACQLHLVPTGFMSATPWSSILRSSVFGLQLSASRFWLRICVRHGTDGTDGKPGWMRGTHKRQQSARDESKRPGEIIEPVRLSGDGKCGERGLECVAISYQLVFLSCLWRLGMLHRASTIHGTGTAEQRGHVCPRPEPRGQRLKPS